MNTLVSIIVIAIFLVFTLGYLAARHNRINDEIYINEFKNKKR